MFYTRVAVMTLYLEKEMAKVKKVAVTTYLMPYLLSKMLTGYNICMTGHKTLVNIEMRQEKICMFLYTLNLNFIFYYSDIVHS